MHEDEIAELNEWFANMAEKSYGFTYYDDGEDVYVVADTDMEKFCAHLRNIDPDLIGIPCMVGKSGIWFRSQDLKNAKYY